MPTNEPDPLDETIRTCLELSLLTSLDSAMVISSAFAEPRNVRVRHQNDDDVVAVETTLAGAVALFGRRLARRAASDLGLRAHRAPKLGVIASPSPGERVYGDMIDAMAHHGGKWYVEIAAWLDEDSSLRYDGSFWVSGETYTAAAGSLYEMVSTLREKCTATLDFVRERDAEKRQRAAGLIKKLTGG